ncbi:hypothetical protein WOLCODRAFT_82229 [Wolfiporia cocos MD-104 SS10]|uniref:Uncharacterized protein n=1 Tax=Wolfiporia cocos (strain MD-104) TaxID=742152 RepID=A0A2H3JCH1_WOLCO|nr:hypothetical protein WOLCODRAFT_82229 [Wolfiporia cocos MD-104 SS10]
MQTASLSRFWLLLLCWSTTGTASAASVNVTLEPNASQIVYSPPACNITAPTCDSAWCFLPSPDIASGIISSTEGPTVGSGALVPQLFLTFTGIGLYIRTSNLSTATANVTLSTQDPTVSITTQVHTAAGLITVVDLPPNRATTLALTYIPANYSTRLDISNITIVTAANG